MPWAIAPGQSASFAVNMNLAGKAGTVIKTISFATDKGTKHLLVRTTIVPQPSACATQPATVTTMLWPWRRRASFIWRMRPRSE